MQHGYVKLWRRSIEGGWLSNHKLWAFWCWCLMKATHKEFDFVVGYTQVHLMPGEFVFGLRKAAKELKISIQSIRTLLNFLKTSQNLTIKSTHLFSIITIINWDTYQSQENEINTPINTRVTHGQHTGNNKQEHKNIRTKEYTPDFLQFYNEYPKHIGKEPAWKAWQKLNGSRPDLSTMLLKINEMKKSEDWTKDNGKFIPHPATWLNQKRWEDEGVKLEVKSSW